MLFDRILSHLPRSQVHSLLTTLLTNRRTQRHHSETASCLALPESFPQLSPSSPRVTTPGEHSRDFSYYSFRSTPDSNQSWVPFRTLLSSLSGTFATRCHQTSIQGDLFSVHILPSSNHCRSSVRGETISIDLSLSTVLGNFSLQ